MSTALPVKPPLKWVGGKSQILEVVLSKFPAEINNYYEPFVGGASVLLGLLAAKQSGKIIVRGTVYASDANENLIYLYKNIQTAVDKVISEVDKLISEFSEIKGTIVNRKPLNAEEAKTSQESYYYWIRGRYNAVTDRSSPTVSAMLIFLNKTCFRGLYRTGPRGFNVPFGNYSKPGIADASHLRSLSSLLKDVIFSQSDFASVLVKPVTDDFVYLDPPYAPESSASFVSYNADGFNEEKHKQLFSQISEIKLRGVQFLLSNADVPIVRAAFPAPTYLTTIISCRRAINSKKPDAKTNEVLISGL